MSHRPTYSSGDPVRLGDIVSVGADRDKQMRVVVIIPTSEAADGFSADEWSYLARGVLLQDEQVFGLLHLSELDETCVRVQAA